MSSFPFSKDDGKRKWTCFVCGHLFTKFNEYQEHVINEHEEGKDYIICPLERCKAPVRDIKMHFKCKHPRDKMPKGMQTRATIWRDKGKDSGKLKARKPKFRQGTIISDKNGGKEIFYRSGYECEVYECLESLDTIVSYAAEPFNVPYSYKGVQRKYIVDLSVKFKDGRTEIWEIKPANQTSLEKNQKKWEAAKVYCEKRNWKFRVIKEHEIRILREAVQKQLTEEYKRAGIKNPFDVP